MATKPSCKCWKWDINKEDWFLFDYRAGNATLWWSDYSDDPCPLCGKLAEEVK